MILYSNNTQRKRRSRRKSEEAVLICFCSEMDSLAVKWRTREKRYSSNLGGNAIYLIVYLSDAYSVEENSIISDRIVARMAQS